VKAARVYLKPDGSTFYDFGLADDATMVTVRAGIGSVGGMEGGLVFVPADVIHRIVIYSPEVPVTTLTVFPGGKSA
jgi:hypothetical protein